ncbi:ABC transporter permease, partial [bacterium M00.F.Ca.ET.162.01.1.1]
MPDWTLTHYLRMGDSPVYAAVLRTTLEISLAVTTLVCVLVYPIAYALMTGGPMLRTVLLIA